MVEGFTKRYRVHRLVWYELHESIESAIEREKQMKEWKRKWKLELIEAANQNWRDLYYALVELDSPGFRRNDRMSMSALMGLSPSPENEKLEYVHASGFPPRGHGG